MLNCFTNTLTQTVCVLTVSMVESLKNPEAGDTDARTIYHKLEVGLERETRVDK